MAKSLSQLVCSLTIAAFASSMALTMPAFAAETTTTPSMATAETTTAATVVKEKKKHHKSPQERVEKRIKELHDKLKITSEQEKEWNTVADTMRDSEKSMHDLIADRHAKGATRTALDDLGSYQKIAAAHAESLSKFINAFQPLYQNMSDEQKKNADGVFGTFEGHRKHHKKSHKKDQTPQ